MIPDPLANGYTVYSKRDCVWCERVKELIYREAPGVTVNVVACDDALAANREEFIKHMQERTELQTIKFPLVFHQGAFIGGYTDTRNHLELAQP